jgi:hypothetical protein
LPLVARRMAPTRDLICGVCDGDVCDMGNPLPPVNGRLTAWPVRRRAPAGQQLLLPRQSATPLPWVQPENA